ncbi:hypothetical protein E2542_SST05432 [Spatholobus suberectus]|nr:hypothetical protein E2542_SST05432 [Spatholobus suberectus]
MRERKGRKEDAVEILRVTSGVRACGGDGAACADGGGGGGCVWCRSFEYATALWLAVLGFRAAVWAAVGFAYETIATLRCHCRRVWVPTFLVRDFWSRTGDSWFGFAIWIQKKGLSSGLCGLIS